jgi:hypothetical protein
VFEPVFDHLIKFLDCKRELYLEQANAYKECISISKLSINSPPNPWTM